MLKKVLWVALACAVLLAALAISRSVQFTSDEPKQVPIAPAAEDAAQPAAEPAPAPQPVAPPAPPTPEELQVQEDAAAVGMTTLEPEPEPEAPVLDVPPQD